MLKYINNCQIIGAILIISGLYFVLWGKIEECKLAKAAAAAIQSPVDNCNNRPTSHIKSSLA
ncbi:hypothetical protein H5410_024673 [Solanum commersonii]|uniref:Uncharacterized protein n=1 Tax=Solanum commersonii TaxID=4109 RepID=A0A9J5ZMN4_SOLCO|nr:hypothetical protein H5410_024673 [Solanum commersonii]